ncbi:hypothetical protein [Curtobacterium sp. MCBA15_001]|uniref:hypothetical protein n=1 Tax=Curtobacterium sp. MCBA15_001 TaxID=1898731 RepID=UPI0008DDA2FA|nr:hypothetical protein [Curtobacterium sp. MCBA15_001]OIH92333.1 hypothetical protein BIU90_10485 [Curtobacterium sp. MCBA15_001]
MSRRSDAHGATTVVEGVRAVIGAVHVIRAGSDRSTATFHRVVGLRQVAQAGITARVGSGNAHTVGAAVDVLHGATMLPLLLAPAPWRRVAGRQLVIAVVLAVAEIVAVGTGRRAGRR